MFSKGDKQNTIIIHDSPPASPVGTFSKRRHKIPTKAAVSPSSELPHDQNTTNEPNNESIDEGLVRKYKRSTAWRKYLGQAELRRRKQDLAEKERVIYSVYIFLILYKVLRILERKQRIRDQAFTLFVSIGVITLFGLIVYYNLLMIEPYLTPMYELSFIVTQLSAVLLHSFLLFHYHFSKTAPFVYIRK
jgi:hypothetical protein